MSASGARSASLTYDPLGRLFQTSGGAAGVTQFLYDGDALIAEYDSAGTMARRYIHGTDATADDPLIWYDNVTGGWRRGLFTDHQGSVIAVTDMGGTPIAINGYDAWGIPNAGNVGRFQYTGQAWIPELGMYYYKARIYSPTLGRFLQTDPVGYKDQVNLYAYVGNDPVDGRDPSGLADVNADCSGKTTCHVDMQQRVNVVHQSHGKTVVDSTIAVTMHFSKTTNSDGAPSWSVSASVSNVAGKSFSGDQLTTMATSAANMQLAAIGRGFGETTTQMVTAIGIAETRLGTSSAPNAPAFKVGSVNPMQLSSGRANLDLGHNIRGAMDVLQWAGRPSGYDPTSTYGRYSDGSAGTMANWAGTYGSLRELKSTPWP